MANISPEHYAHFELNKAQQLMGSLNQLANNMRECATVAEQFAQMIGAFPYGANPPAFAQFANGQFPGMPVMPPVPIAQDEHGRKRKARGEDADGKRKIKKPKDPNAPKRPPSSYLLFQNDVRSELKAKNPEMRNNELLGAIAKLWSEMPQEQKDTYEQRNKAAKDNWLAQKAIYESGKVGATPVPVKAAVPVVAAPIAPVPVVATTESSDDDDDDDEDVNLSGSVDGSSDDEEPKAPVPKKLKKEAVAVIPAKDESKKEKKHKKTKA